MASKKRTTADRIESTTIEQAEHDRALTERAIVHAKARQSRGTTIRLGDVLAAQRELGGTLTTVRKFKR